MQFRILRTPEQKKRLKGTFKLFNAYRKRSHEGKGTLTVVELNLYRILAVLGILASTSYLFLTIGLFTWVSRQEHNQIAYWDIALPHRWSQIDALSGKTKLIQASDDFEKGEYKTALFKLRSGLARYPHDLEARSKLAQLYMALKRPDFAIEILEIGFDYGYPEDEQYIENFFKWAFKYHQYESIDSVTEKLLNSPEVKEMKVKQDALLNTRVKALLASEDYERLYQLTHELNTQDEHQKKYYREEIVALIHQNKTQAALERVQQYAAEGLPNLDLLKLEAIFKTNDIELIQQIYGQLKARNPQDSVLRQKYIVYTISRGELGKAEEELRELTWMFGNQGKSILSVAAQIADYGQSNLIDNFFTLPLAKNKAFRKSLLSYKIQALIVEKDWKAAREANEELSQNITQQEKSKIMTDWIELLTGTFIDENQLQLSELVSFLKENKLPHQAYLQTAKAFQANEQNGAAMTFIESGLSHHPFNLQLTRLRESLQKQTATVDSELHEEITKMISEKQVKSQELIDQEEEWVKAYKKEMAQREITNSASHEFSLEERVKNNYVPFD